MRWAAILLGCALAATARAEPPRVVTLPAVLVGVGADRGAFQRALDDRLDDGIRRSGRAPMPPGPLTGAELGCRDAACMARIAEGADIDIVLGAKVVGDRGSPPSYRISLVRYDRDRPGTVRQEQADCSVCTYAETAERLQQMVATMLPTLVVQPRRAPDPPAAVSAPAPVAAVVAPAPPPRGPGRRLLFAAIGVSAATGVAGLAMLGAGGRALAIDGDPVGDPVGAAAQTERVYDTRPAGLGLTIVGSLLVVSAAAELGVEVWLLRRRAR